MQTVYMPEEDSYLMKEALVDYLKTENQRPKTVLDMGTGSGVLAIEAAKAGCNVTAADINPDAIKLARDNAKKQGTVVNFIQSDLFENISQKFDLIVFNPPYVRTEDSETQDLESAAWAGGKDGMQVINHFLSSVCNHLNSEGHILLLVSSTDDNIPKISNFKIKLIKKKSYFFERLFVLKLSL